MMVLNLYKSDRPEKKYFVEYINPESGRLKRIYFGSAGYNDYTTYSKDIRDERKKLYLKRHKTSENWNKLSAGMLSRYLLWNQSTLNKSIKDVNERYNIKIKKKFYF
jgi:hypothetical protein